MPIDPQVQAVLEQMAAAELPELPTLEPAAARQLYEPGVPTTMRRYDGQIHTFCAMAHILDAAQRAHAEIYDALRRAFAD